MTNGISANPLNPITKVYLDTVAKAKKAETQQDIDRWTQTEAKVDTGSSEEKATARNKRNTPPGANRKFDTSVFITRKPGESLDSARTRTRQKAHAAQRGVKKEGFSNWRDELREVADDIPVTDKEMEKKVTEKKVNNKVVINPKMSEAIEEIGGTVLSSVGEEVKDKEGLDKYDRHKRMIRHKQDKYGRNVIGADYNLENERKAKGWKKKLNKEDFVDEAAKDQSSKQLDRGMKTTQKAMGVIDNSPYGKLSDDKVDRMNKRLRDRRKDISGEKTSKLTKLLKKEDKAFDNVVSMLRKKHGESSVITKDSPKPKAQPRPKAKPQKPLTAKEKAHREVIARYGGEANYKAGRGLGT